MTAPNKHLKAGIGIAIFSIAMAALEAAVVVYLRALYYPEEFTVAFKLIDESILLVELAREAATLVMLMSLGYLVGRTFNERLAWFLMSFAIWDIFYYGWLKVFIGWPATFFDWDILFLIPVTWIGPVAAPLICSLLMIVLSFALLRTNLAIPKTVWAFIFAGVVLTLFTFIRDYTGLIIDNDLVPAFPALLTNEVFLQKAAELEPKPYLWNFFWMGQVMFVAGISLLLRQTNTTGSGLSPC
jgi:hypothetical protein